MAVGLASDIQCIKIIIQLSTDNHLETSVGRPVNMLKHMCCCFFDELVSVSRHEALCCFLVIGGRDIEQSESAGVEEHEDS